MRATVDAAESIAHARNLLADPDWGSQANLAAASGLDQTTIRKLREGTSRTVEEATARAVLAVTPALLRRKAYWCPIRIAQQRLRSLQAQRWPAEWLAGKLNVNIATVQSILRGITTSVRRPVFDAVERLYRETGDRTGPSSRAACNARSAGWHPAIHYTDDGRLIPEAVRDERVAKRLRVRDEQARIRLQILALALGKHQSPITIANTIDTTPSYIRMVLKRELGLRYWCEPTGGFGDEWRLVVDDVDTKRAAEIVALLEAYEVDPTIDGPYELCVRIGLMKAAQFANVDAAAAAHAAQIAA